METNKRQRLTGCRRTRKFQKNRHTGVCRGPEDVDFIDPTSLDPGLVVTPEWLYPGRDDGVFFDILLDGEIWIPASPE
jgi:hypothetical protein